jgi:hypothetical protein
MSTLGKTLADAVQRAEERDEGLSQRELRAQVERADKVLDGDWRDNWKTLATQQPKGADEARIELSQKVTDFMGRFNAVAGSIKRR